MVVVAEEGKEAFPLMLGEAGLGKINNHNNRNSNSGHMVGSCNLALVFPTSVVAT